MPSIQAPVVLVAEHEEAARQRLVGQLSQQGYQTLAATDANEALHQILSRPVAVLIAALQMPGGGLTLLDSLAELKPDLPVIVTNWNSSVERVVGAWRRGAVDCITEPLSAPALAGHIEAALREARRRAAQRNVLGAARQLLALSDSAESGLQPVTLHNLEPLSVREREVAQLVAEGLSVDEMATRLHISPHTIRNHLKAIFKKLEVTTLSDLLLKLLRG